MAKKGKSKFKIPKEVKSIALTAFFIIVIFVLVVVLIRIARLGVVGKAFQYEEQDVDLSNYPFPFKGNSVVVIGDDASFDDPSATLISGNLDVDKNLSSEITDIIAQNIVAVGHPCNNSVVEHFLSTEGMGCRDWPYSDEEAMIKLFDNEENLALVVAGTTPDDTKRATLVLVNYLDYSSEFIDEEVCIEGTSLNLTDISVRDGPCLEAIAPPVICTDDDLDNYYLESSGCEGEAGFLGHDDCDDDLVACGADCNPGITDESTVNCSDGYDNDCDTDIDCYDSDCDDDPTCAVPGPVAKWKFDEGSGTTAADSIGDNNGTINGATWTTGVVGYALEFDGVDDFVQPSAGPQTGLLDEHTAHTVSAWILWKGSNNKDGILLEGSTARGYQIAIHSDTNEIVYSIKESDNFKTVSCSESLIPINQWAYVAGTYDGTAETLELYINGVSCNSPATGIPPSISDPAAGWRIGGGTQSDIYGETSYYFNGTIDEVKIYNYALTADEIEDMYNAEKPVVCIDDDEDGYNITGGVCGPVDCNDTNASINPGAAEICDDIVDNDCDGDIDCDDSDCFADPICIVPCVDNDQDGYNITGGLCGSVDCNDTNASIYPGATEICNDTVDNDCDTDIDCDDDDCIADPVCIVEAPPVTFNLQLQPGWNLISIPLILENDSIEDVLADIRDDVIDVWTYNPDPEPLNPNWEVWHSDPTRPSNLQTLELGRGYWIKMNDSAALTVEGVLFELTELAPPPSFALKQGWNLVGIYSLEDRAMSIAFASLGNKYSALWTYNPSTGDLVKLFSRTDPALASADPTLEAGKGYWVYMIQEGDIVP